jgi:hypothetical protein
MYGWTALALPAILPQGARPVFRLRAPVAVASPTAAFFVSFRVLHIILSLRAV